MTSRSKLPWHEVRRPSITACPPLPASVYGAFVNGGKPNAVVARTRVVPSAAAAASALRMRIPHSRESDPLGEWRGEDARRIELAPHGEPAVQLRVQHPQRGLRERVDLPPVGPAAERVEGVLVRGE